MTTGQHLPTTQPGRGAEAGQLFNGDASRKDGRLKRSIHVEPQPHTGLTCLTQLVAGLRKTHLAGVESRRRLPIVSPINPMLSPINPCGL